MDDLTIKLRDSASRTGTGRHGLPARPEPAPTQSATAAPSAAAPRSGATETGPHDIHLAPQSQKVIDREREVSRKRRRISDDALLRMRAYGRPLLKDDDEPENYADLEA